MQLVELALLEQELLLGEAALGRVLVVELLELLHTGEALGHRLEVGEEATEPALVDVGLAHAGRLLGEDFLRLLLGADEEDGAAVRDGLLDELVGLVDVRQRLLEVDDVDTGALGQDEALDLRVPPAGLVSEVHAAVEQLADGDEGHGRTPVLGAFTPWLRLFAPFDRAASLVPGAHPPFRRSGGPWGVDAARCADPETSALRCGHAESSRETGCVLQHTGRLLPTRPGSRAVHGTVRVARDGSPLPGTIEA
ncbi:hypothetical protein SRABI128_01066 [Microbacterium sp. Bi128]|nr:hypothetical protein SRABI128_01066 [Microbacterium sp. Bi128]